MYPFIDGPSLHMAYIKQARLFPCPVMRVDDAEVTVLHWHGVAAKGHKFGAMLAMKLIQASLAQLLLWRLR